MTLLVYLCAAAAAAITRTCRRVGWINLTERRFAVASLLFLVLSPNSAAAAGTPMLVGTVGDGNSSQSVLYEIDPNTGATIREIGPVGYIVNGLEYDPTTGILYGSTSVRDSRYNGLIKVDLNTGAGTPIGINHWGLPSSINCGYGAVTNITVNSSGQMFGWLDPCNDDLVRIDKTTGTATVVGNAGIGTGGNGLDFDNNNILYLNQGTAFYVVNTNTGAVTFVGSATAGHHGDFHPSTNRLYAPVRGSLSIRVIDLVSFTSTNLPTDRMFHVVTFVPASAFNDPPTANAGPDQSVNEGDPVALVGGGSVDPDGDILTYFWEQIGGTTVTLLNTTSSGASFTTPLVPQGTNETLTFRLTVKDPSAETDSDTVNITVVNVNHIPVADADVDQSVAEGSPVNLNGSNSYDVDGDTLTYSWLQVGGPAVTLSDSSSPSPNFAAPVVSSGGAPGVVAMLEFALTVNDGYGGAAADNVIVEVTNVNNLPVADAGAEQTKSENSAVVLNGSLSSDPDGDTLSYSWVQINGPSVTLTGATTAAPSLTTPFVNVGGADLTFALTVNDGYGGTSIDTVVIHVQNANDPPLVSAAQPTLACLWPPDHKLVQVGIIGVSDPDQNAVITITGVTQDEPTNGLGDGDTAIDAVINSDGTVMLRAERAGNGNGRVYHISFTASDLEGSASGVVTVCVPRDRKSPAIDGGGLYNSTE